MRQINPYMAAARRSGDPSDNAQKQVRFLARTRSCLTDMLKYRLHYNEDPVGMVVRAHPMEIHAWNTNARAFFAHQISLGRESLPILEWRQVGKDAGSFVWRVKFRQNGKDDEKLVSAPSKAGARREFESMASVTAVIKSIEQDEDVEGAILAIRAQNGELPEGLEPELQDGD